MLISSLCLALALSSGLTRLEVDYDDYARVLESVLTIRDFGLLESSEKSLIQFLDENGGNPKLSFVKPIFNLLIADIRKLKSADQDIAKEVFKKLRFLLDINTGAPVVSQKLSEKDIDKIHADLIGFFGSKSYFVYSTKSNVLCFKMYNIRNRDYFPEIENYVAQFSNLFGDDNPERVRTLIHFCLDAELKDDWKQCLKYSKICVEIQARQPVSDMTRLSSSSFYLLSLSRNKHYDEAIAFFNQIPKSLSEDYRRGLERQQFRIFSGMADAWRSKNKNNNAIAFQELALVALTVLCEKSDFKVKAEAVKLRNMLVERNEWTGIRNLESRYALNPLPKSEMEK